MMLQRDPAKRPSVHQLLKVPCIEKRITRFLHADVFKEEFAHTLLHNQNVFEEFRKMQVAKKAAEEEKKEKEKQEELKRIEQQRLKQQMEQMHLGYKPP
jgi:hypothetical protein